MSVDWAELTTPEESAGRGDPFGPHRLAVLTAGLIWKLDLVVLRSCKPENAAHCDIWGDLLSDGSSQGVELRARLANELSRVLGPYP